MSEGEKSLVDKIGVDTVLIIIDLILTTLVAVITTMRFRAKCGKAECACKPKDQSRSPGSVDSPTAAAALGPPPPSNPVEAEPSMALPQVSNDHSSSTVTIVVTSPRPGESRKRKGSDQPPK